MNPDLVLVSASGGTDVATAFAAGTPITPVYSDAISCRCLGVKLESFDDDGRPITGAEGELVVTAPMPSMPVGLWGDENGDRYRAAWFNRYPGVWAHGDWVTVHHNGSPDISGRSDATLNRGGVRLGTSDFYSVIEAIPGIQDSLVVHLTHTDNELGELLLFVVTSPDTDLTDDLRRQMTGALRKMLSPRHVPDAIIAIPEVPRTATGKKLEVPVKRILEGAPMPTAASPDAMQNPQSLQFFVNLPDRIRSRP